MSLFLPKLTVRQGVISRHKARDLRLTPRTPASLSQSPRSTKNADQTAKTFKVRYAADARGLRVHEFGCAKAASSMLRYACANSLVLLHLQSYAARIRAGAQDGARSIRNGRCAPILCALALATAVLRSRYVAGLGIACARSSLPPPSWL